MDSNISTVEGDLILCQFLLTRTWSLTLILEAQLEEIIELVFLNKLVLWIELISASTYLLWGLFYLKIYTVHINGKIVLPRKFVSQFQLSCELIQDVN